MHVQINICGSIMSNWNQKFSKIEIESYIQKKEGKRHEYIDMKALNKANERTHTSKLAFFAAYQAAK